MPTKLSRTDRIDRVVTHILARFHQPTTQVERGWMNSNAATLIALDRMAVLNTVGEAIISADEEGRIFFWNRFFLCGWEGVIHAATGATYSFMTEAMHRQFYYARKRR